MRNAKKTLSLVMIAIFTTFIVLSGIPAGAVTAAAAKAQVTKATTAVVKVEKTVKVSTFNVTTAQTQLTAANKEVSKVKTLGKTYAKTYAALAARTASVNKKIAAKKLAIEKQKAALAKAYADANKAVEALEKAVDADNVDLVADAAALATAQGAVTSALEYIEKLDKNSSNYKGLMARVDMANTLISDAVAEVQEAEAAAEKEAAEKAAKEAAAKLEAEAQTAAETAVKAVEDAVAANDFVKADTARKEALVKVDAVKDVEKNAAFAARLAAALVKTQPAIIKTVTAIDGTITVNFDKTPITTVAAANFTVTRTITTTAAVTTAVVPTAFTTNGAVVNLAVPTVPAIATAQSVVYSVVYNATGAAVAAPAYAVDAVPTLTATASASSLREVVVVFNQAVDTTSAETVGNYAGITATSAVLGADGKTVTLKVNALTQQTAYTLTITGVKSAATMLAPTVTAAFTALDTTVPSVVSVAVTGPKELTVTFSEIMNTTGTVSLDNGSIYVTVPGGAINAKTIKLSLGTILSAGSHSIVIAGFYDQAGFKSASQTLTFNYATDTTLPTATLTSATQTQAVFTFSKPVVLNAGFSVYHTFNKQGAYAGSASLDADGVTLTVTFPTPIAAGNVTFFLNNATDSTALVDGWSNKFVTTTLSTAVTADTTAPTAVVTSTNNTTLKVVYSEPVLMDASANGALLATNYVVKDASGKSYAVSSPVSVDSKTVNITVAALNGGSYYVTVSNVKDKAVVPNTIVATAQLVAVKDVVNPTVSSAIFSGVVGTTPAAAKMIIKFSEEMNAAKLADKANYVWTVDGSTYKTLTADDTLTVSADGKSVTIALAAASFSATAAQNIVKFGAMIDLAGNPLIGGSTVYPVGGCTTQAAIDTLYLVSAKATSTTTVVAKFNQSLTNAIAGDFVFNTSTSAVALAGSIVSITSDADGFGYVTLALNTAIKTDGTYGTTPAAIQFGTITTPTAEKSALGAVLTSNTTGVNVDDAIVPVVSTAKFVSATSITLTMSEAMKAGTFAPLTANGFSVSAGTITSVSYSGGVITLTGTDFTSATTVSYNATAGLTDASDNALATFTAKVLE